MFLLARLVVKRSSLAAWDVHYLEGLLGGRVDLNEHARHRREGRACHFCDWYEQYQESETLRAARRVVAETVSLARRLGGAKEEDCLQRVRAYPHGALDQAYDGEIPRGLDHRRFDELVRALLPAK